MQIQLQNDDNLSTSKYTLCTIMFIWLVILINSLLLYTVVMWVNVGTGGTVVKNGKMQCIIHTVFQPLLKFLPCNVNRNFENELYWDVQTHI